MIRHSRRGLTVVELLVAVSIIGILTGVAAPTILGLRRSSVSAQAMTDLRAVDIAVQSSCGRGRCGNFNVSSSSSISRSVPVDLKGFLPLGFRFKTDSSVYAMEMESWQLAPFVLLAPICVPGGAGCPGSLAVATWEEDVGFTNTAGFTAPLTIYVTVSVISRQRDVVEDLYARAGGSPPMYISSKGVWKYAYPVMMGVPATG
ncbi:MAG: prepilin-type N-terminal cleavage/methylation domain-containing protein [Gemmatimonadetes bacterium]|nr:prepilin-type N-terminal cleavage/methylation domain-containing protein [Gemmatimonadota bacterium]